MTAWLGHQRRLDGLASAQARLAKAPEDLEARFDLARMLTLLGRPLEARAAYLDLLGRDPAHAGALANLGNLLLQTGFRSAARTVYGQAVACHPEQADGHVNLANLLRDEGETEPARAHYRKALELRPEHREAHLGYALLLRATGETEAADRQERAGLALGARVDLPYLGATEPVPALLLMSAAEGNAPFQHLLDDRVFQTTILLAEGVREGEPLPPHRLLVNAIGDADLCRPALIAAQGIAARSGAPVLNDPAAVLATGRDGNAARLARIPGLRAPHTVTVPRERLQGPEAQAFLAAQGFVYPLLLRAPGFHAGRNFLRVADPGQLEASLAALPGSSLTLIEHLDAAGSDGWVRKFRVMMVGGQLYPAHLALSRQWMVHYFSAEMADRPEHRAEEAAFLADMPGVLGEPAMAALAGVRDALALDYAGIDFGRDREGRLLLFEANAAMTIRPPDGDPRWDYRRAPLARILDAARRLPLAALGMA